MLPDFLKTKEKIQKLRAFTMEKILSSHIRPFDRVPTSIIFEGNRTVVVREDGSVEEGNLVGHSVEIQFELAEAQELTPEMFHERANRAAIEMAGKMKKSAYEQIERSAEEVGNVISAGGKPFSIDMYFEMLEKIEIDFDEAGNPSLPMCAVSPKLWPSVAKIISKAKDDPENDRRFKEIIEQKREEWRVRESNRKLVG